MARRSVAGITAVVLALEAIGIVLLHIFLGMVVDDQQMSLAGLQPRAMTLGAVVAGSLLGCYLLLCAGALTRMAISDRAPGSLPRILLIGAAVLHGVLGALTVGLVGWAAFALMTLVLALIVGSLVSYGERLPPTRQVLRPTGR
ncbi:hypothetical protein LHJ74_31765 [Streptomyces sp. N2-109]|uniref:Integral membrane protein n=1 Tax=Streptomyces gossypii TaxID=2883101 RepID=A0ABT2K2P1_9ACTN|nr:hypothetical protein [Streptomyces gossypii]MCT2594433.1 hypothetical protein [Streptomyces gossypii]